MSPSDLILTGNYSQNLEPPIPSSDINNWKTAHQCYKPFELGDRVLKKIQTHGNLAINKMKPRYEGPYKVVKVNSNEVSYVLETESEVMVRAHHTQLKRYIETPMYLAEHPVFKKLVIHTVPTIRFAHTTVPNENQYDTDDSSSESSSESDLEIEPSKIHRIDNYVSHTNSTRVVDVRAEGTPKPKKHSKPAAKLTIQSRNSKKDTPVTNASVRDFRNVLSSVEHFLVSQHRMMKELEKNLEMSLDPNWATPSVPRRNPFTRQYALSSLDFPYSLSLKDVTRPSSNIGSLLPTMSTSAPTNPVVSLGDNLKTCPTENALPSEKTRSAWGKSFRRQTRSQGPVSDYPNVQIRLLERKYRTVK